MTPSRSVEGRISNADIGFILVDGPAEGALKNERSASLRTEYIHTSRWRKGEPC